MAAFILGESEFLSSTRPQPLSVKLEALVPVEAALTLSLNPHPRKSWAVDLARGQGMIHQCFPEEKSYVGAFLKSRMGLKGGALPGCRESNASLLSRLSVREAPAVSSSVPTRLSTTWAKILHQWSRAREGPLQTHTRAHMIHMHMRACTNSLAP